MRNLELPGRSPVHGTHGVAATSHALATMTAISIMQKGGNAIDAAVAACAVQCVVEPESTGIGGDCFCLISPKGSDQIIGYNGSGAAPAAATHEWFASHSISGIERNSPHSVTIPGAIDAWAQLVADHGRMSFGDVLAPAVRFAADGYAISSRVSVDFEAETDLLSRNETAARIFLRDGRAPRVGQLHRQPELAATLETIAENGRDAFYTGGVAEDMVSHLNELGGLHTMDDFASHRGEYVAPIKTNYRGYDVFEIPPNGQGITALILLNILSGYDLSGMDPMSVERLHLEIEATRLAYADRNTFIADPRHADVPVEFLLSADHAADLRQLISMDKSMKSVPRPRLPAHSDTVYLCVVDEDRNAVSFINSLFHPFGSGLVAPKSGVVFQNRGCGFVLDPDHPNCIAPGKRPFHTIIPGMLAQNGRAVMPFGVMGGPYQACGHAHVLTGFLDMGLDVQEAIDQARVFPDGDGVVETESGVPAKAVHGLRALGHRTEPPAKPQGGGQAIWIDWDEGVLTGGSDPRKDGCAIGY
jgi:gamma-glutamyltranspeptidase / glutathione hydrolase